MNKHIHPEVRFPELIRESTLEMPNYVIAGLIGAILLPFARIIGLLFFVPLIFHFISSVVTSLWNARIRSRWVRSFPSKINFRKLKPLILQDPQRYTLYVQYYGGFDAVRLRPAALLHDTQTGELIAVHPASYRAVQFCESHGVPIVS
ncbi:hypothetical protein [Bremerella sp. P1]|uniref:hypothetical protein n=1 Tax=Bremerella sp. P1 TaxID=3026424 RepID=UPI002368B9FE|nr:hypothetical protein [Bremerella sp. P1]WDI42185.1 hypothetical protein PSR63_27420 [Bremerella sp. P1]